MTTLVVLSKLNSLKTSSKINLSKLVGSKIGLILMREDKHVIHVHDVQKSMSIYVEHGDDFIDSSSCLTLKIF